MDYKAIQEFLLWNGPAELCSIALLSILALPTYSIPIVALQYLVMQFYMYIMHAFLHTLPESATFFFNTHVLLHHRKLFYINRTIELLIEGIGNFSFIIFLLLAEYISGIKVFSTSIILSGALVYTMNHIIRYSIFSDENHALHHVHETCNYEPEIMDTLFRTRCEPDRPYKDRTDEFPCILLSFVIVGTLKILFNFD
jgi:hypothetical protein